MPLSPASDAAPDDARVHRASDIPPVVIALAAQLAAGSATLAMALIAPLHAPIVAWLLLDGVLAGTIGVWLRLPVWWVPINVVFVPAAVAMRALDPVPEVFLTGFILLGLVFWTSFRSRVPLYLSSRDAGQKLADLIPPAAGLRLLDLGCGFGGLLRQLRRLRPQVQLEGVEIAPLPALVAWLRLRRWPSCRIRRADFWRTDLSSYDVVYAFLSPAPMAQLWDKVRREMRPGTLFVSNSFAVPDVEPDRAVPLRGRGGCLYVWRL